MAFLSAVFTKIFSQKAAGGGIPEVKSVLGGFIMRQVLGAWVLFVKTIGIVRIICISVFLTLSDPN
jgi:chloride channel 3/4/5